MTITEAAQANNPIGSMIVRGMMYGLGPAYLSLRNKDFTWDTLGLDAKMIVFIYCTQTIILSPAALEGTVRGIIHLCQTFITDRNQQKWHQDVASAEFGAAQRITRAAILPIAGYVFIGNQIAMFINSDKDGKSLIEEYYTCKVPYETGRLTTIYVVKPIWDNGCVIAKRTAHISYDALKVGYDALEYVGFWAGVKVTANWAADAIQRGVGLAMNLLGRGQ